MDPQHHYRLQIRPPVSAISAIQGGHPPRQPQSPNHVGTGEGPVQQGSHHSSSRHTGRVCQPSLPCSQARRVMEDSNQSEIAEQICCSPSLQNGVNQDCQRTDPGRGLDGKTGSKGCIPGYTHPRTTSEIPSVQVGLPDMAIQDPAIWPQQCTTHLHKVNETGGGSHKEIGGTTDTIPRRYANRSEDHGGSEETPGDSPRVASCLGIHYQHQEERFRADSESGILGFPVELIVDDYLPAKRQASCDKESSKEVTGAQEVFRERPSTPLGYDGGCSPSHSPSSPALQEPGARKDESTSSGRLLRTDTTTECQNERGADLVDSEFSPSQRTTTSNFDMGPDNRVRLIPDWVGSSLQRKDHRRALDDPRKSPPHKLPGVESSISGSQVLCERCHQDLDPSPVGQHHGHIIYQQNGGHPFNNPLRASNRNMELVHREADNDSCRAPPRGGEYSSRLAISAPDRFQRLEAAPASLSGDRGQAWTFLNRPICFKDQPSTTNLLQLETRPSSHGNRWFVDYLEEAPSLHVPTVLTHPSLLGKARDGEGSGSFDCPSVAQSGVVPSATRIPDRPTSHTTSGSRYTHRPRRTLPSIGDGRSSTTSRMAYIRRSCSTQGLSDRVIGIIRSSWRQSTEAAYSSAWRLWASWCIERDIDPFSAPLKDILEFLSDQFDLGKQYRTINSIRSAISMTHEEIDGTRIGQHPLVSRFLKGVFNNRPPAPKYAATWDVDVVLRYIKELPENDKLSFQALSHKLAMLMALANADRCSDLAALDLDYMRPQVNGMLFIIPGLTKTRRNGPPLQAFYPSFTEERQICPVRTLECYQSRSQKLRTVQKKGARNPLFLSVRKPHKPVKAATIGHWLKNVMKEAGIDTKVFSAHSTRGASTSKARTVGVSTADILRAANWSSDSTFSRFYCRPILQGQFGLGVLRSQHQDTW